MHIHLYIQTDQTEVFGIQRPPLSTPLRRQPTPTGGGKWGQPAGVLPLKNEIANAAYELVCYIHLTITVTNLLQ